MELVEFLEKNDSKYMELFKTCLSEFSGLCNNSDKDQDAEKTIVTAINSRLSRAGTRSQGLELLITFCSKLSRENLNKQFSHWMTLLTQFLTNAQPNSQDLVLICRAIGAFIEVCKKIPELDKQVSINNVKQIIGIIVDQHCEDKSGAALSLVAVLLYYYPESCARHQATFSKIISSQVDQDRDNLVNGGAKCYSLLVRALEKVYNQAFSKCSSVNLPDSTVSSCYIFHQISLCNHLHSLMDQLFQDIITNSESVPEDLQNLKGINILQLSEISCQDLLEYYTATERRFSNLCLFLSMLLRAGGKSGKNYALPHEILRVVFRGLAIIPTNLQPDADNKKQIMLLLLPKLHLGLCKVLYSLISSFKKELVPFALSIQRLLLQTLDWTKDSKRELYISVRNSAYENLCNWLNEAGSCSGFQLIAEEFLPHIIKDISPQNTNIVILTAKTQKNSTKSKDKSQNSNRSVIDFNEPKYDSSCSEQAILALQSMLCNCHLKQSFFESIRDTVISLLYQHYVKRNSAYTGKSNSKKRLLLLRTLRLLQTNPHLSLPNPTQYSIQIFGVALSQEYDSKLIEEAKLGLSETRLVIHPSGPTLMIPHHTHTHSSTPSRSSSRSPSSSPSRNFSRTSSSQSSTSSQSLSRSRSRSRSRSHSPVPPPHSRIVYQRTSKSPSPATQQLRVSAEPSEMITIRLSSDEETNEKFKRPRLEEKEPVAEVEQMETTNVPTSSGILQGLQEKMTVTTDNNVAKVQDSESDDLLLSFCDVLQEDEPSAATETELLKSPK